MIVGVQMGDDLIAVVEVIGAMMVNIVDGRLWHVNMCTQIVKVEYTHASSN